MKLYKFFHEVLAAMLYLHRAVVRQLTKDKSMSTRIAGDSKYALYFKDCIRALDSTHIAAYIAKKSPTS
jgi:hypothetical protein